MVSAPSEHSGCRLMTRNEHGHQVVTQLLIGGVGIPDVHQEAQQAGVPNLRGAFLILNVRANVQTERSMQVERSCHSPCMQLPVSFGHSCSAMSYQELHDDMTCICASTNRCSAHLCVVALLQGLDVLWLLCALGEQDELVQALVHDRQVCAKLTLPRHHIPAGGRFLPLRNKLHKQLPIRHSLLTPAKVCDGCQA